MTPTPRRASTSPFPDYTGRALLTENRVRHTTLTQSTLRRELYSLGLYRILAASTLAAIVFSPWGAGGHEDSLGWSVQLASTLYLIGAILGFILARATHWLKPLVVGGTLIDIAITTYAMYFLPDVSGGIAMLLLFHLVAAAMLLPLRETMALATLSSIALAIEFAIDPRGDPSYTELFMFVCSFLALSWMGHQIGNRARASQDAAGTAQARVANLVEINELIIRRLRTGVLVVNENNQITLANEAASQLLGQDHHPHLEKISPELLARLNHWRETGDIDDSPLTLLQDRPDVLPRFASILADDTLTLIFLDDARISARRAETMTLATLGRFSTSLAHEVRNPLAAIRYATQLLQEMRVEQNAADQEDRLLDIIYNQTQRTNQIVESVLSLARREQALPIQVDLTQAIEDFQQEWRLLHKSDHTHLTVELPSIPCWIMIDPRHLQQILTILIHNAEHHGRDPSGFANLLLRVTPKPDGATLDIIDHGPGIPDSVAKHLFEPFFTTSPQGTGLGLYIAHELARANQANLTLVTPSPEHPQQGAHFRLHLSSPGTGFC